jgi:hypothetical protein
MAPKVLLTHSNELVPTLILYQMNPDRKVLPYFSKIHFINVFLSVFLSLSLSAFHLTLPYWST